MAKTKLSDLINRPIRVFLSDNSEVSGELLAFDGYMNLVIADAQEVSRTRKGVEQTRTLGLIVLRGERVLSTTPAGPAQDRQARLQTNLDSSVAL